MHWTVGNKPPKNPIMAILYTKCWNNENPHISSGNERWQLLIPTFSNHNYVLLQCRLCRNSRLTHLSSKWLYLAYEKGGGSPWIHTRSTKVLWKHPTVPSTLTLTSVTAIAVLRTSRLFSTTAPVVLKGQQPARLSSPGWLMTKIPPKCSMDKICFLASCMWSKLEEVYQSGSFYFSISHSGQSARSTGPLSLGFSAWKSQKA